MNKTLAMYLVWVRNKDEGCLTPVYETALCANEAVAIVRAYIDPEHEEIDSVFKEVKWK